MGLCRVYFIIDNRYAKELVEKLISIIRSRFINIGMDKQFSSPVNVCSDKMRRFEEGLLRHYYSRYRGD